MLHDLTVNFWPQITAFFGIYVFLTAQSLRSVSSDFRPRWIYWFSGFFLALAVATSLQLVHFVRKKTAEKLEAYAPAYAKVIQKMGHELLNQESGANDPIYLGIIEMEKEWLSANPFVGDIYTMNRNNKGDIYILADSETDYNRDGKYSGDREMRTPIGEIYEKDLENLNRAFSGERIFTKEIVEDRWGAWVSAYYPLYDANGKVNGILGVDFSAEDYLRDQEEVLLLVGAFFLGLYSFLLLVLRSRSKLAESEKKLGHALIEAKRATDTKAKFLATISHEIRTPLNGILGAAELVKNGADSNSMSKYIKLIDSCGAQLLELVNDVLDFSKLESHSVQVEKIPLDIRDLIKVSVDILRPRSIEKDVKIEFDDRLGRVDWILGDPTRLRQVILNLLSNAIKFTKAGRVTIRAEIIKRRQSRRVKVSVIDSGIGISAEDQSKLFVSFSQVDASTTRLYGGTGLGLAISRGLIELMSGRIWVESVVGRGSKFMFEIPLLHANQPKPQQTPPPATAFKDVDHLDLRIAVVDDNEVNRIILGKILERLGLECAYAKNGQELLELLGKEDFDLIFLDGHMPVMDGYEAAERILALKKAGKCRAQVVAVTADAELEPRQRFLNAGVEHVLLKPISVEKVSERILAAIENASLRRSKAI